MHTLLLADDSITVQRVIALTFAGEPIQVVAVSNGQQAMAKIATQRLDVILAATTLSQVSGYDLAQYVRSRVELQEVPVLLLSGAFETVDEAKLKASGANGVIEKPVEPIAVIARVKELLGLKSAAKPAPGGRLVTSPDGPAEKKPPVSTARTAISATGTPSNWEQLREQSGLGADTRSVEASSARPKSDQDTLDVAFDSLDQQLSGRRELVEDLHWPELQAAPVAPLVDAITSAPEATPHDIHTAPDGPITAEAPAAPPEPIESAVVPELVTSLEAPTSIEAVTTIDAVAPVDPIMPAEPVAPVEPVTAIEPVAPSESVVPVVSTTPVATILELTAIAVPADPRGVADDFAALLAYEQGEAPEQPVPSAPVEVPAPQITEDMLDQIASRVAERLSAGLLGEHLRAAVAETMRDTVRDVVSETSERLVRDEIDRIKSQS